MKITHNSMNTAAIKWTIILDQNKNMLIKFINCNKEGEYILFFPPINEILYRLSVFHNCTGKQ